MYICRNDSIRSLSLPRRQHTTNVLKQPPLVPVKPLRDGGAASNSDNAEVVDARVLKKDGAAVRLPACLLHLKREEMASHLSREGVAVEDSAYDVNWGSL